VLCFPHAGAGASSFHQWRFLLPSDVHPCAIQLPGRENRITERPFTRLSALVETLVDVLEPVLQPPFALFGHSMGALVAFELARRLREVGAPQPMRLIVAARRPPQLPFLEAPLHELPDAAFLAEIRRLKGTPDAVLAHPELMQLMTPLLRADMALCETYQYLDDTPLECPISVLAARGDPSADPDGMADWRLLTTARTVVHAFEGDHFFVQRDGAAVVARVGEDVTETLTADVAMAGRG
jgi:surfactin synthase thioesterase subunit